MRWSGSACARTPSVRSAATVARAVPAERRQTFKSGETSRPCAARRAGERAAPGVVSCTSVGPPSPRTEAWARACVKAPAAGGAGTTEGPGGRAPHPRLHERRFVLEPLAELNPGLEIPGRGRVSDLLAKL